MSQPHSYGGITMMRKLTSLRGAHLVLWSSPILLLILVFTLSSQNTQHPRPSVVETTITTTTTLAPAPVPTTAPTHHVPVTTVPQYSAPTTTTVKVRSVPTGALNGVITSSVNSLNVPVNGPGTWVFSASLPTNAVLICAQTTTLIVSKVIITTDQECQLELSSQGSSVWQLLPAQ